jgi:hypothetical protein
MNFFPSQDQEPPTPLSATAPSFPSTSTTKPTIRRRRAGCAANNPALGFKLAQMALPLAPLVQLTTGRVHPVFPASLLHFWLLTDAELEALADFYHQREPGRWTLHYPCPVAWDSALGLEDKRRKMGRFIGLRGCESPVHVKTEDEILEEARLAGLAVAESEEEMKRKFGWYR